jgi:hypothetical protein
MEWVGQCTVCSKDVYCRDGFLDGVVAGSPGILYCHDCFAKHDEHDGEAGEPDSLRRDRTDPADK